MNSAFFVIPVLFVAACGGSGKPAEHAQADAKADSDQDGVADATDKCPGLAAKTADGCPEAKPTNLVVTGAGTYEPVKGEKREFTVKTTGQGPSELEPSTKKLTMDGEILYKDSAGKEHKAPVKLKGTLDATRDDSASPFSFADVQMGIVPYQTESTFSKYSSLPVRLKLTVGMIPDNLMARYGVSLTFMRAAFDGAEDEHGHPNLTSNQAFDSFELGFMGRYFLLLLGEKHWFGVGAEGGAVFTERVTASCESKPCEFSSYPASVEAYASVSFDWAYGVRDVGGPHVTLQPIVYSSHSDNARFMLPVYVGFEF